MCRKKLVSAVRAATLSVVGRPWRKMEPHTWDANARSGFPSVGRALTLGLRCRRSYAHRLAVALAGLGVEPPLGHGGVARLTVHRDRGAVDHEVLVGRQLDVDPV